MSGVNAVGGVASNQFSQAEQTSAEAEAAPARAPAGSNEPADEAVNRAVAEVRAAYQFKGPTADPPALAASKKLLEVTRDRAKVTPEQAARIFQGSRDTVDRIIADLALKGPGYQALRDRDNPGKTGSFEHGTYDTVVRNLSLAMDSMGRAQDVRTGQYLSPLIESEVRYVGRQLAERVGFLHAVQEALSAKRNLYASRLDAGFKQAAAEGSAILALETARQLAQPEAPFAQLPSQDWDPQSQAQAILSAVREGAKEYDARTQQFFGVLHQNLAPVLAPLNGVGQNLTEAQQRAGIANIFSSAKDGDKVRARIESDQREADERGYQLLRFGETVGFYTRPLEHLSESRELTRARGELLNSLPGQTLTLLSKSAMQEIDRKIGLKMPEGRYESGHLAPTMAGLVAQAGDFAEYRYETGKLKVQAPPGTTPVPKDYGTFGSADRSVPRYNMPADVAGMERAYSAGEYRKVPPGASAFHPGTYAINPSDVGVKSSPYEATRMGRIPAHGLAVWGVGGLAQAALTEYIISEVGFAEGQEFRKALLVGLVGGFAGFHLAEAVMAGARLVSDNQPWTRFSVAGTTGVTGSLTALMSIATAWDITGVYYNAMAGDHLKTGTHSVNLLNDLLLLRLQTREFSKRILPSLIDRYGANSVVANVGKRVAVSRTLSYIGTRFFLSSNPIGATVNVLYGGTAVINYGVDRYRYVEKMEDYHRAFLRGAGVGEMQADVLKQHGFWTAENAARGFNAGYRAIGGSPEKYVDYVNGQTDRAAFEELVRAARKLPDEPPQNDPHAVYLALPPEDPATIDLGRFPNISWNAERNRFEDSASGLYYDAEWSAWRREDHQGDLGSYYYPDHRLAVEKYWHNGRSRTDMTPTGTDGWRAYLGARGKLPLP